MHPCFKQSGLAILLAAAHVLAHASQPELHPISLDQVARALSHAGIEVRPEDISLAACVAASKPNPEMEVLTIEPASSTRSGQTLWVRIACRPTGVCLPFYASVVWDRPLPKLPKAFQAEDRQSPPAIGAGTQVTMVIPSDRSLIQVAVVALQSGSVGQIIRVASPDRKQFYRAKVVSASLLKESM